MLVEIAIADTYAAAYEFTKPEYINKNHDMKTYRVHPRYGINNEIRTEKGQYTDDTQMSIAIAELVYMDGIWNQFHTLNRILKCFKRDPRKGYSKRMQEILEKSKSATDLMKFISPIAESNGAAIRSVPLALLNRNKIVHAAVAQASATHATRSAIESSILVGLIGFELLHGGDIEDAVRQACQDLNRPLLVRGHNQPVSCHGILTVRAAYRLLQDHDNLYDILNSAVKLGGDTDSVAAIAVGWASLSHRYINNLPDSLYDGLEPESDFGLFFLEDLDKKLFSKI